jgi:endogenous inhibitor of DNA gyrase (YacG/DUF329 family)
MGAVRRCPICKERLTDEKLAPFCSERCKLIDLGSWLSEGYRISAEPVGDEEPKEET